jgi:hypothetical protein
VDAAGGATFEAGACGIVAVRWLVGVVPRQIPMTSRASATPRAVSHPTFLVFRTGSATVAVIGVVGSGVVGSGAMLGTGAVGASARNVAESAAPGVILMDS